MGKLLTEIRETKPTGFGKLKKVDLVLQQMSEQDRKDLLEALNDLTIQSTVISRVLKKRGIDLSRNCISKHRGSLNES